MRRFILGAQLEPSNIIEVPDREKTSFRPSKWPQKFRNQKTAKNSKLPTNCFEPVGIGGWPPISTWIIVLRIKEKFLRKQHNLRRSRMEENR
jgi:hypothetical protein